MEIPITLETEFIKLDSLLKLAGIADSGGQAKLLIADGLVALNGETVLQRGRKIRPGDKVTVDVEPRATIIVD